MLLEARLLDERREGKVEGRVEEKAAIAKLMLAKGCYSPQEITELTGLSLADLTKLKNDMLIAEQA